MRSTQKIGCAAVATLALLGAGLGAGTGAVAVAGAVAVDVPGRSDSRPGTTPKLPPSLQLQQAVRLKSVVGHLRGLQRIADEHDGNRASGEPGYRASARYVAQELRRAGYRPEMQAFEFPEVTDRSVLERVSPDPTTYEVGVDFVRNEFEPTFEGAATGPLVPVGLVIPAAELPPSSNTSGCEPEDFAAFPEGGIALLQRGTCDFSVKAANAQEAGAAGAIVMNEGQPDRSGPVYMSGEVADLAIPVVGATSAVGEDLASTPGAEVTVEVAFDTTTKKTWNVVAETRRGNHREVVMAGAHLDSVAEGAGINDNGTGSAALLEAAIQLADMKPRNAVRFAWWGAEEVGLLGSDHYVSELRKRDRDRIALYLNFDMIGSPNPIHAVYDGNDSSDTAEPGTIPKGSAQIEKVFKRFYTQRGEKFEDSTFDGRSDYGPFIAVGIPAGGIFSGAEVLKTEEQAEWYGGVAGAAYDPCYHEECDTLRYRGTGDDAEVYDALREDYRLIGNVNADTLDLNSDALAASIARYAFGRIPFADATLTQPRGRAVTTTLLR